jgi:hypothetical protein
MPIRLPSAARSMSRLAVATALAAALLVLSAGPALADTGWTVRTGGPSLNLRSGPGTSYPIVGSLPNGATVHVYCTKWGETVNGNASWDYLGGGRYATDSLIETGTNGMGAPLCSSTHHSTMEIDPTGTCGGSLGGGAAGVRLVPPADWYEYVPPNVGCYPHDPRYYWTGGNGPQASGDYFQWLYYAGAYASCDVRAYIPPNDLLGQGVFYNAVAEYSVWTGRGLGEALFARVVNQNTDPDSSGLIDLGSYQADGSGVLALRLDDYSLYKYGPGHLIRVAAAAMLFDCTQYTA